MGLHTEAVRSFNSHAKRLIDLLVPRKVGPRSSPSRDNDTHVTHTLGPSDIDAASFREYLADHAGNKHACYFFVEGRGVMGLEGLGHDAILRLAGRLASHATYSEVLSGEFIYDCIVDWLQLAAASEQSAGSFVAFLEEAASREVKAQEIWLPIPTVSISRPFKIGAVEFRRVTKAMMDDYATSVGAGPTSKESSSFDHVRTKLQAVTAAVVKVTAERIKAAEVAALESESAIGMLRFACPTLMIADHWAPIAPDLIDGLGAAVHLTVIDGKISQHSSQVPAGRLLQWLLEPHEIARDSEVIWGHASALLTAERSAFQDILLKCLLHYSKSVLKADVSERLLYVVSALEALFVRRSEAIVQNLAERLAMIQGGNVDERLAIIRLVEQTYDLRSRFVHGALPASDLELLTRFYKRVWALFLYLLSNHECWKSKDEFIEYVDSYKFRGPVVDTSDRHGDKAQRSSASAPADLRALIHPKCKFV